MLPNMCSAGVMVYGQWAIVYPYPSGSSQDVYIGAIDSQQSVTVCQLKLLLTGLK